MKQRLLLLAATTGYQIRVFADIAARLELDLVLATDRCHILDDPWGDHAIAVRFQTPEKAAAKLAAAGPFDGLLAVGDQPTLLAAMAAVRLGLEWHTPAAVAACRDKYLARELYQAAGLRVPEFFRVPVTHSPGEAARRAPYPCVLKPLGLSGSRGVIRANDARDFAAAFRRIATLLADPEIVRRREDRNGWIQVEGYIPGREYALEGVVSRGQLRVVAIFDKPDPLDGPFFEETIYVTPSGAPREVQDELVDVTQRAVRALGLRRGPVHAELRHNEQGAWMLEIAARPIGGLCAKALRFEGGLTYEEFLLRHALGDDVSAWRSEGAASGVMMIPIPREGIYHGTRGLEDAVRVAGIDEAVMTATEGQKLTPLPEGSSYLGFLFARAASPGAVEQALREAHSKLSFDLSGTLPVFAPQRGDA